MRAIFKINHRQDGETIELRILEPLTRFGIFREFGESSRMEVRSVLYKRAKEWMSEHGYVGNLEIQNEI